MSPKPIVKWAGGKSRLLSDLVPLVPDYGTYFEPFIGGAAMLLSIQPEKAVINDYNPELINLYQVVKDDPERLIANLEKHKEKHSKSHFYEVRLWDRIKGYSDLPPSAKAGRFMYLNKTCYNGLWRVNVGGFNNVPMGLYKNPDICPADAIREVSDYFNRADVSILNGDFQQACATAQEGDFVYFDPPYDSTFVGYTDKGFNKSEQERLARVFNELTDKGVKCMLSNSYTEFIRELYSDFTIKTVQCSRAINANGDGRGKVDEVVVMNYE